VLFCRWLPPLVVSGSVVNRWGRGTSPADPHRDRGAGAARMLGSDLDVLVPTSRTTASTACSCRSLTTDPPTTWAEKPAAGQAPRPSAPPGSAKSGTSRSVGSWWWARCSAGGGTAPTLHAAVACPVLCRSPHPASEPAPAVPRAGARGRARSRPRRYGGPRRPGGRGHGRPARPRSRPPTRPAPPPTPPHRPHRFRRSLVL
jgi:hypothetical protein